VRIEPRSLRAVRQGALRLVEKGILLFSQSFARRIERRLRSRDGVVRNLHLGRVAGQGLAVDIAEAQQ
jgi:hypothetical protein